VTRSAERIKGDIEQNPNPAMMYFDCGQSMVNDVPKSCNPHLDLGIPKLSLEMTAIFGSWWGGVAFFLFRWEVPTRDASPPSTVAKLHLPFSSIPSRMQEDGFDTWTAENLDRKDLLAMWKSITHALISTGHVAELHQELDYACRTGREDLSSGG
jgi:hypothetical protein